MEVKLTNVEVEVSHFLETGHALKEGDKIVAESNVFILDQVLSNKQLLVHENGKNVFLILDIDDTVSVMTKAVLECDINFKHVIQKNLFNNG